MRNHTTGRKTGWAVENGRTHQSLLALARVKGREGHSQVSFLAEEFPCRASSVSPPACVWDCLRPTITLAREGRRAHTAFRHVGWQAGRQQAAGRQAGARLAGLAAELFGWAR